MMQPPEKIYVVVRSWCVDSDGYEIVGPAYTTKESAKVAKEQLQHENRAGYASDAMYAIKAIDLVSFCGSFHTKLRG